MTAPPQNADDVRRIVKDAGIEFLFAQFVDMHVFVRRAHVVRSQAAYDRRHTMPAIQPCI